MKPTISGQLLAGLYGSDLWPRVVERRDAIAAAPPPAAALAAQLRSAADFLGIAERVDIPLLTSTAMGNGLYENASALLVAAELLVSAESLEAKAPLATTVDAPESAGAVALRRGSFQWVRGGPPCEVFVTLCQRQDRSFELRIEERPQRFAADGTVKGHHAVMTSACLALTLQPDGVLGGSETEGDAVLWAGRYDPRDSACSVQLFVRADNGNVMRAGIERQLSLEPLQ